MPTKNTNANLLASLFGSSTPTNTQEIDPNINSQSMDLLQASVSSMAVLEEKSNIKSTSTTDTTNINIVSDNALVPNTSPTGVSDGTEEEASFDEISVYVVRKGDSIGQIADMFKVSANTILWANNMKKGDKLSEGDVLIILPIDGVKHVIAKGDTLKKIAAKYQVEVSDITGFNDISIDAQLVVGNELIIPDAEMSTPTSSSSSSKPKTKSSYTKTPTKNVAGYFINPVPGYSRRSQGLHGKNGIDLAAPTGTKILASASGKVIFARNGYNGGYGNMVIIQHSNGTQTLYAHMSRLGTTMGSKVSQGQVIGYVGSTGHSTGPHIHFEVHGAKNPGGATPMSWSSR
ncbi:MAG TPA: LysM peptidoglycan-binding domain-containing M23 family metallopeptidase [Candidatus Paceibacterota bacterium]|nr:LysM peptidoglycan-binding domain-containing M23 family metallopeptidase [Candidatus Paceibacterota bacterium]HPT18022.1 LysM peptidoglycan-binding domain-containing M23 family metallopeptidase [Candidatus Paceibacterota bacterium]